MGIGFLVAESTGTSLQWAFLTLAHRWPLLLVISGLVLLAEWALDRRALARDGIVAPRRSLGALPVLLLLLLVVVGAMHLPWNDAQQWGTQLWAGDLTEDGWGLSQLFAQHSVAVRELSGPLAPGGLLVISNYRGGITISGSSQDGQVHISARQRTSAWQRNDLRRRQQRNLPSLTQTGSGLALTVSGEDQDQTDLTIEAPHTSGIQIMPETGEITVSELRGPVNIENHRGNVDLTALTGPVKLVMEDDNADVRAHSLTGDLSLHGRAGDLSLSDLHGSVQLAGDFFGTTHLEDLHGSVNFQSSFTKLTCAGIAGDIDIEGRSELHASNIDGPLVVSTTDRNLHLEGIRSGVNISDQNGSVDLSLLSPVGPVSVITSAGSIEVKLPPSVPLHLAAETADGNISANFLHAVARRSGERTVLEGQVGVAGPLVRLRTTQGDITAMAEQPDIE